MTMSFFLCVVCVNLDAVVCASDSKASATILCTPSIRYQTHVARIYNFMKFFVSLNTFIPAFVFVIVCLSSPLSI